MERIVEVDPADPRDRAAFDAWYDAYLAAEVFGREEVAVPWLREEARIEQGHQTTALRHVTCALLVDDVTVAAGRLEMSLRDNLALAAVGVRTHPAHRRRGYATRLLDHLTAAARSHGRSVLVTEVAFPYDGPADGAGTPGVEFARARGYELALDDVMRQLPLPVDPGLLDRLAVEAAAHHPAYTLRSFVGAVPDDLALGVATAAARLNTDAPTGTLELEPETPDVPMLRDVEDQLTRMRRTKYTAVALTADGTVAAYTDLVVPEPDPSRAMQWGTLVLPEHRGHRLGLAVKVANLRLLQAERSDVRSVVTWNAAVNRHMVGVNERLGFRPAERLAEFQRRLPIGPTG